MESSSTTTCSFRKANSEHARKLILFTLTLLLTCGPSWRVLGLPIEGEDGVEVKVEGGVEASTLNNIVVLGNSGESSAELGNVVDESENSINVPSDGILFDSSLDSDVPSFVANQKQNTSTLTMSFKELQSKFEAAGQGHVFRFADKLNDAEKAALEADAGELDLERIGSCFKAALAHEEESKKGAKASLAPLVGVLDTRESAKNPKTKEWYEKGLALAAEGKVGVLLLAGGQGTRLGSSDPKGQYDIGLPSHKSLFQIQAERLARVQVLAGKGGKPAVIPWYVMTSPATSEGTQSFFKSQNYFGLDPKNIMFFNQGTLPCLTNDGKVIMETSSKIARAPDGNGGLYRALEVEGVLADMKKRGIVHVHMYCVDNCLVKVADPVFVGGMAASGADCGAKAIEKVEPDEPVGVIAVRNGAIEVVEYSEIDAKTAAAKDTTGKGLAFNAANIANHYYTVDFLERAATGELQEKLLHHVARKKIKHVGDDGVTTIAPTSPNGVKLEQFVFDVFPYAAKMVVMMGDRSDEFSPLKNAPGNPKDSPDTARRDFSKLAVRYIEAAGGKVTNGGDVGTDPKALCEISPLLSYSGENLEEKVKGKSFTLPVVIE